MPNPVIALGDAIGKSIEAAIVEGLRETVEALGYTIGSRNLTDLAGITYQIDAVVSDGDDKPVVIIESKYIRSTQANRDKGSWLCVAHYNLCKTYPTIRKSIAVLAGRWSAPSQALIRSFGVEIVEVPFAGIVAALARYDIPFDWPERDRDTPRRAWETYEGLDAAARRGVAEALTADIVARLRTDIVRVLETDLNQLPHRISEVEILLKTDQDEMLLLRFDTAAAALAAMAQFVADRPDIGGLLQPRGH